MSASAFSRVRRNTVPIPKGGQLQMGYYNPAITSGGKFREWSSSKIQLQNYNFTAPYLKAQVTMDNKHGGPPYKEGGAFRTLRIEYCSPYRGIYGRGTYPRNDGLMRYVGGFGPPDDTKFGGDLPVGDLSICLASNSSLFPDMTGMGDKGYALAKPKLEKASGFVFVAEARDIPKMLKTTSQGFHDIWKAMGGSQISKVMQPKKLADQFLNHQFGWSPFLGDLRRFDNVIQNAHSLNSQLTRNNGQAIRRRVTLGSGSTSRVILGGNGVVLGPGLANDYFSGTPTWQTIELEEFETYAVGRFRYYRPEFDSANPDYLSAWNVAMRQMTLYGLRPSPSNIYKATPWTWAVDWVSNFGDHIDYLTDIALDSISCSYFYVMHHRKVTRRFIQTLPFISGMKTLQFDRVIESKQRQEGAGPYGFSLTWDQLTPRQIAIAGALGISRR